MHTSGESIFYSPAGMAGRSSDKITKADLDRMLEEFASQMRGELRTAVSVLRGTSANSLDGANVPERSAASASGLGLDRLQAKQAIAERLRMKKGVSGLPAYAVPATEAGVLELLDRLRSLPDRDVAYDTVRLCELIYAKNVCILHVYMYAWRDAIDNATSQRGC